MTTIAQNIHEFEQKLAGTAARLLAVTKTKPVGLLEEAYAAGIRDFGENRVQEMVEKHALLPKDLRWHLIGHLQTNKVKYIAPFVHLIHSVDSLRLLEEINRQAARHQRVIDCLLQVFIAQEDTKFGLSPDELYALLDDPGFRAMQHVRIRGLMGMATNTDDLAQVRAEFRQLRLLSEEIRASRPLPNVVMEELSMGMSGDWDIAVAEGSTMIRVGSAIFGSR